MTRGSKRTTGDVAATLRTADSEPAPEGLVGTSFAGRFELRDLLGVGAHGAVYEAWDNQQGRAVALKTLLRIRAEALVRFKREFRRLSNVSHPNLVSLHELFVGPNDAYFTMELVAGTDFLEYVRGEEFADLDEGRLRDALPQLARGLMALHGAGLLHRDLKPSNVLVDATGHVRVADFGLAMPLADGPDVDELAGTPAYMSPEQAANLELSIASDWYSLGVMLHEALTGEYPYQGLSGMAMLMAKQLGNPDPPSKAHPGIAADLDALCQQLLLREASERAGASEVLAAVGGSDASEDLAPPQDDGEFLGRAEELEQLRGALQRTSPATGEQRQAVIVRLHGRSGWGKSALLARFIQDSDAALVLHARCYERESVPYKGLDGIIDALWAYLVQGGHAGVARTLPDASALARLFPVLEELPGLAHALPTMQDPIEVRRQAVAALRELLHRIAADAAVAIVLDDLQWCDRDAVGLLVELWRHPDPPPILFIGSYRSEDATSPALAALDEGLGELADVHTETVSLKPLDTRRSVELARGLLPSGPERTRLAQAIAREAEGSPLLIAELARYVGAGLAPDGLEGAVRLEAVVQHRARGLPTEAQRILELVAVAARPTAQGVIIAAAQAKQHGVEALALLRTQSFVRTHGAGYDDAVEPFHDRIGAAIADSLASTTLRHRHASLGEQLERRSADPEHVAFHLQGAGETQRAAGFLADAAEQGAHKLAFDQAARLYGAALDVLPLGDRRRVLWARARGDALANDGRGKLAAEAYLEAVAVAAPAHQLELRGRAAEQLLRSGHLEEGEKILRRVLEAVGLHAPAGPRRILAALGAQRARIRLRGTEFHERSEHQVDPDLLLKIDTSRAAATGLLQSSVLTGQYFQARHLLLALDGGEPHRVARALAMETLYAATAGTRGLAQTDALLEQVEGLCRRLDDARALAAALLASGVADVYRGRFANARPRLEHSQRILREQCTGVQWELAMVNTFLVLALFYLGDVPAMTREMDACLRDAADRDDLHAKLMVDVSFGPIRQLFLGRLDAARETLADLTRTHGVPLATNTYRYARVLVQSRIDRYAGRGRAAWAAFEEHWTAVRRSLMLRRQPFKIFALHDRGLSALAAAREVDWLRARYLRALAGRQARALRSEGTRWSKAMATPIEASLAAQFGDRDRAARILLDGERTFVEGGLQLYAASMRRRRGELTQNRELIREADESMTQLGVADPACLAELFTAAV